MSQSAPDAATELVFAIHGGDVGAVARLIAGAPELAGGALGGPFQTRTALHVVCDWPGYFPNGPEIARVLLAAGADPDARQPGDETPLHWAASSDDADVAAALIDGGADVNAPDGSIGTPLENAVGYGCWHVARLLAARGRGSTSCGWRRRWASSTVSTRCSTKALRQKRCRRRSGTPAPVASAERRNASSPLAPTWTGNRPTATARPSMPPTVTALSGTT